jgi:ADP-ribose pyrophosphatase
MKKKQYLSSDIFLINAKYNKNELYHYFKEPDNVIIIPVVNNKFILVKQKRIPINKKNIEFPMGRVDLNEDSIDAAGRELLEETGYQSMTKLNKLVTFFADPGRGSRRVICFYTKNLKLMKKPEKGIQLLFLNIKQISQLIYNNKFNSSSNIAAFYYFISKKL